MAFLQGERDAKPVAAKPKKKGRVIVIGAGPAGLAAALHLKVSRSHFHHEDQSTFLCLYLSALSNT